MHVSSGLQLPLMGHKHGYQPIESTKSMWSAIMDALSGAASTVGSIWSTIVDAITRAASTVKSIWSTILDAITEAASAVSQHLKSTKPWIGKCLRAVDEKISTTFREVAKFVKDHPRACAAALIAIVLLVAALMGGAPAVFTTCGFTAGGIAKGSLAATWQSLYGGAIPAGSLFAVFQGFAMRGF